MNLRNLSLVLLGLVLGTVTEGQRVQRELDLPTARIYSVDSTSNRLRPWTKIDSRYETTVENVEKLRLDCMANYPVQWIYSGNGIPEYTATNKYSRMNTNHGETSSDFTATILISPLKEHHTGKYQCSPAEFVDSSTFFYIYVPGANLFTSFTGHNIVLPKNDTTLTIPCSVSNPNAAVTLDKSERDVLRKVKVRSSDAVVYDPKIGFKVRTDKIENPEGTYVCTAKHGSFVRSVEYQVKKSYSGFYQDENRYGQSDQPARLSKCSKQCGENAFCDIVNGRETCQCLPLFSGEPDLKCTIKCNSHTDCPDHMSCFVDRQCRDPCIHSAHGCGINAQCKTVNHRPTCSCPPDWVGDETVRCYNTLQGSEPSRPDNNNKPSSSSKFTTCTSNTDCPGNLTCIRASNSPGSPRECIDPCSTRRCGRNAECLVEDHRSHCQCLPGFNGDARIECESNKYSPREPAFEPLVQGDQSYSSEKGDYWKRCNNPGACGPNSECQLDKKGNDQCDCKEGFAGQAPKCRPECKENKNCPDKHVCFSDTRVGYPTCAKQCGSKVCGAHAACAEFEEGNHECYCPEGLFGDPFVKCETRERHLGRDCSTDYDCGIKLRCEIGPDERKCVDPCEKKSCRDNFVCEVESHRAVCKCPKGHTGNEYVGCLKTSDDYSPQSPCASKNCGANAECRMVNKEAVCFCQSGFVGKPPACTAECSNNLDCPSNLTCVQKRCRYRCSGCGKNAKCRVAPNVDRSSVCSCLNGYEGNPYVDCKSIY